MITQLNDKSHIVQPETGYLCVLLSADAPDPENPGFYLDDGTTVWSIVMVDARAPQETIGEPVIYNLDPKAMLKKLQKENWETF